MTLQAHYTFDNVYLTNVYDEKGNYDGITVLSPDFVDGQVNECIHFQTTTQYVSCGAGAIFSNMSIAFWLNPDATADSKEVAGSYVSGLYGWAIQVRQTDTAIRLRFANTASSFLSTDLQSLTAGEWVHICYTHHGGQHLTKMYMNGVSIASNTHTLHVDDTQTFRLGGKGVSLTMKGFVDEFMIYDHTLTQPEIRDIIDYPTVASLIKQDQAEVFRRLYMKRLIAGEYESDWQQIENKRIRSFGKIEFSIDDVRVNFYKYKGYQFKVDNYDGYFNDVDDDKSFFYDATTLHRTMVKVEVGYKTPNGIELPSGSVLFTGILGGDPVYPENNIVSFKADQLSKIFEGFNSSSIPDMNGNYTASEVVEKIRDHQDLNNVYIFRKYITSTSWNIDVTTLDYEMATTTTLQNASCWELMIKLAEAEDKTVYVSKDGQFYFQAKTVLEATPTFHFSGIRDPDKTSGHNVMKNIVIKKPYAKVYNRILIKHALEDVVASNYILEEDWVWGDLTSSFLYGVRTYKIENEYLTAATAVTIAQNIYAQYKDLKKEITLNSKFIPQVNLNDNVSLTYKTKVIQGGDLWGKFDYSNGLWGTRLGFNINIDDEDFRITKLSHNIDKFYTTVGMRE